MKFKDLAGKLAATAVLSAAVAGASFADDYSDAVRQISAPPRATIGAAVVRAAGWDGVSTERPTQNDDGAWIIKNEAQLAWFATASEGKSVMAGASDVEIHIDADLDLNGHDWTQISAATANINVHGNGHVIKGLTRKSPMETFGLFGTSEGNFEASDLHLVGVDIRSQSGGALLASIAGGATITGCTVQGKISSSTDSTTPATVGGFVGRAAGAAIRCCVADIEIEVSGTGYSDIGGGIIGSVEKDACTIDDSAVYGSVFVKGRAAGGIVGLASSSGGDTASFENTTNNAAVTLVGTGSNADSASYGAGGIVGVVENASIESDASANYGTIKAEGAGASQTGDLAAGAGGLVGAIFGEDISLGDYKLDIGRSANFGAVASTMTGTVTAANKAYLGAGGLVGSSYYKVDKAGSAAAFEPDITSSRNTGAVAGNDANSAGGMLGYLCTVNSTQAGAATAADISSSYNSGAVSAPGGIAGGIVGSLIGGQITGGSQNTTMSMSQVYSSVVPTGRDAYGFFGTYDGNGIDLNSITDPKHADNGTLIAWPSASVSYAADMNVRGTFVAAGNFWDGYLDSGVYPPELDRTQGNYNDFEADIVFALRSATATRLANGEVALRIVELPDGQVRATDAVERTYEVSVGGTTIARGLRLVGGVLTIPANAALVEGAEIEVTAIASGLDPQTVPLSLNFAAVHRGEVQAVSVRGVPVIPSEDAALQLYLEWVDADGATHSNDMYPADGPIIKWSVVEPKTPNWEVAVAPSANDPYRATLTISKRKAQTPSYQEYGVQVRVSYGGDDEDIVYTRKFFAGAFPTQVLIGPDQQEMIDAANAVLARTNVAILPGNFQPVMSGKFIDILEQRIADGLVHYVTDRAVAASDVRAGDDPREVYVLKDMSQIEALMTPTDPEPDTLPVCFECTDKKAANISLDIGESRLGDVAPEAVGKIVLLPMTYSVGFESDDMTELFGANADAILADPNSALSLGRIFEVLVLHKRIKEGEMNGWYTRLVSGVATPIDARGLGMMEVDSDPDARELTVRLAYNVINYAGESFVISGQADGASLGYMILPDGLYNGTLIDPLWPNIWKRSQNSGDGSGGGGCAVGGAALLALAALAAMIRRGKK